MAEFSKDLQFVLTKANVRIGFGKDCRNPELRRKMQQAQPLPRQPEPPDISHIITRHPEHDREAPGRPDVTEDPEHEWEAPESPDISHIITEDDTPVDNIFSEKQQRLLTESLNSSWNPGRPFVAAADVGIFHAVKSPPVVPDMFLSLDVRLADDLWEKRNRSYFLWEFGKPPEVVVEVVSNTKGGEAGRKLRKYARIGVWYYVVFDPQRLVQEDDLRIYKLVEGQYVPKTYYQLKRIGLGVTLWDGEFEGSRDRWLRWCDSGGSLVQTGLERAEAAEQQVASQKRHTEAERQRAEAERQRAERLAAKLRSLGVDPEV